MPLHAGHIIRSSAKDWREAVSRTMEDVHFNCMNYVTYMYTHTLVCFCFCMYMHACILLKFRKLNNLYLHIYVSTAWLCHCSLQNFVGDSELTHQYMYRALNWTCIVNVYTLKLMYRCLNEVQCWIIVQHFISLSIYTCATLSMFMRSILCLNLIHPDMKVQATWTWPWLGKSIPSWLVAITMNAFF